MKVNTLLSLLLLLSAFVTLTQAQSPNTAAMIVVVTDQTGAVVTDARVTMLNSATGDSREAVTGTDGRATFAALSLTGTYKITVAREGFGTEERQDLTLRPGETATLKGTLLAGSQAAQFTVYGTPEGEPASSVTFN